MTNPLNTDNRIMWFDDFGDNPSNDYRFLSNFYEGESIALPGWGEWRTGEHLFQAAKTLNPNVREKIRNAVDPGEAKFLGRRVTLRPDWEAVKYDVMASVLKAKFTFDREEGRLLYDTGDRLLVEGTYWHDEVWGVDLKRFADRGNPPGRNWLGTLLMARRAELRAVDVLGAPERPDHHFDFWKPTES